MKAGEWLQWRRDSQRTGRVPMPGRIRQPGIVGSLFLGGVEEWLVVGVGRGADGHVTLPDEAAPLDLAALRRDWGLDRWVDVEGSGRLEHVEESFRERYLPLIPGKPGLQRLFFESAFDKGMQGEDTRGWLEERVGGEWRRLWTTPADRDYWQPSVLLADVDGDGEEDIVLFVHYRVMAFKAQTGEKVRELAYHHYRNYGEAHAVDLTGNGLCDFVQLVEFPAHLEVILNDGDAFRLAWYEDIQQGEITDADHALSTPFYPVADTDGDGQFEVVYARLNQHGDGAWHTLILDALTGQPKHEIAGFVVQDLVPCGPAGTLWLFGTHSDGAFVPKEGGAAVYEISAGAPALVWSHPTVAWCLWAPNPQLGTKSTRIYTGKRVACSGDGGIIWCREGGGQGLDRLSACRISRGKREVLGNVELPDASVQAVRSATGEALVTSRRRLGELCAAARGLSLAVAGSQPLGGCAAAPVVFRPEAEKDPLVVVPDLCGEVLCVSFSGPVPLVRWHLPGHGMADERGICVGQVGEDRRYVLLASRNGRGEARVVQVDAAGATRWAVDISRTHPAFQGNNRDGGVLSFQTLPLRQAGCDDVIVTSLKNNMHSGFTCALASADGQRLWRQDKSAQAGREVRGFGGARPFAGLPNERGTEDLVSEFPDLFFIAEGTTGACTAYHRTQFGCFYVADAQAAVMKTRPALYGIPVVLPQGIVWGNCPWVVGLWQEAEFGMGFRWFTDCHPASGGNRCPLQAVGDLNGDGRLQLVGWEFAKALLTCRDLEEGDLLWTLDMPGADCGQYYATCDIDGDGREECILCTPTELLAIGERDREGVVKWGLPLPAGCTQPVVADVDGDAAAEILLPCQDGSLYLVDDAGCLGG